MNFYPGFDIKPTTRPLGFEYGPDVFGPTVENQLPKSPPRGVPCVDVIDPCGMDTRYMKPNVKFPSDLSISVLPLIVLLSAPP